jgi:hypothetical protein
MVTLNSYSNTYMIWDRVCRIHGTKFFSATLRTISQRVGDTFSGGCGHVNGRFRSPPVHKTTCAVFNDGGEPLGRILLQWEKSRSRDHR